MEFGEKISTIQAFEVFNQIINLANSFSIKDDQLKDRVVTDIEKQALRESNVFYVEDIYREHLDAVYNSIKNYRLPNYLLKEISHMILSEQ